MSNAAGFRLVTLFRSPFAFAGWVGASRGPERWNENAMAWAEIDTEVLNPANRGAGRKGSNGMAKRMSDKQIRYFGTSRQKAALKAKRSRAAKKNFSAKKSSHRPRTATNPGPEMLALTLGNPATRGRSMATAKKQVKKKGKKHGGGFFVAKKNMSMKSFSKPRRKGNPGALGSPMDWLTGGAGVLAGVVGTRALPQVILGDKNTGGVGYFSNAVVAAGLGWVSHLVFPRNRILTASVLAGGFAALIARVVGDFTNYGKFLSLTGVGDYMMTNAPVPSRLIDPDAAMMEVPTGWGSNPPPAMISSGVPSDMMLANSGVDLGRRAGVC